jgi:hypothetical protein
VRLKTCEIQSKDWEKICSAIDRSISGGMSPESICEALRPKGLRKVVFCGVFISLLIKVYRYCKNNKTNFVVMKDFKKQQGIDTSEYARMSDLVRFEFATRPSEKNGEYLFDVQRIYDFITGDWAVAAYFLRDQRTDSDYELSEKRIKIGNTPSIEKVIEEYGDKFTEYVTKFEPNGQATFL